jgi:hypothetical protein
MLFQMPRQHILYASAPRRSAVKVHATKLPSLVLAFNATTAVWAQVFSRDYIFLGQVGSITCRCGRHHRRDIIGTAACLLPVPIVVQVATLRSLLLLLLLQPPQLSSSAVGNALSRSSSFRAAGFFCLPSSRCWLLRNTRGECPPSLDCLTSYSFSPSYHCCESLPCCYRIGAGAISVDISIFTRLLLWLKFPSRGRRN